MLTFPHFLITSDCGRCAFMCHVQPRHHPAQPRAGGARDRGGRGQTRARPRDGAGRRVPRVRGHLPGLPGDGSRGVYFRLSMGLREMSQSVTKPGEDPY